MRLAWCHTNASTKCSRLQQSHMFLGKSRVAQHSSAHQSECHRKSAPHPGWLALAGTPCIGSAPAGPAVRQAGQGRAEGGHKMEREMKAEQCLAATGAGGCSG